MAHAKDGWISKFQFVDMFPMTGRRYDNFPMTGKGDFDIHNVHSCHVETVVLLRGEKVDGYVNIDLDTAKLKDV